MTIKGGFTIINYSIVTIYSHYAIVIRDEKGEDFLVKFLLSLHGSIELDDAPHSNRYTMSILLVSNIKRHSTTLNFIGEKWKVHLISYDEE